MLISVIISLSKSGMVSVPHPDAFWAYRFLEVKDWIGK